ncbi:MAG: hypothetical protein JWP75_784 [Frondihabitans sp.]|nr:hypothetical protein [Frondihabitans sp.]
MSMSGTAAVVLGVVTFCAAAGVGLLFADRRLRHPRFSVASVLLAVAMVDATLPTPRVSPLIWGVLLILVAPISVFVAGRRSGLLTFSAHRGLAAIVMGGLVLAEQGPAGGLGSGMSGSMSMGTDPVIVILLLGVGLCLASCARCLIAVARRPAMPGLAIPTAEMAVMTAALVAMAGMLV